MKKFSTTIFLLLLQTAFAHGATFPATQSDDAQPPRPAAHGALSSPSSRPPLVPPPQPPAENPASAGAIDGYAFVGFDQLAGFPFKPPAPDAAAAPDATVVPEVMSQIPESIRKLDGQKIMVTGFMLPTKIENGLATEFLLLNSPMMCCYGVTPSTNAWIVVKMPKGVPPIQDVPMPFHGRLHVHAQWENGWLASVYQLDGDDPAKPSS